MTFSMYVAVQEIVNGSCFQMVFFVHYLVQKSPMGRGCGRWFFFSPCILLENLEWVVVMDDFIFMYPF